jgi:4-hydroxybutyrate CoA-transferase
LMSGTEIEHHKRMSAGEAVGLIKSNDRILLEGSFGEPVSLIEALMQQRGRLRDVEVITASPIQAQRLADEGMAAHFKVKVFFARGGIGGAIRQGRAEYIPVSLWGLVRALEDATLPLDAVLIQVSPPDQDGYCSLGISVGYLEPAVRRAKLVIAEVNEQMPMTFGDSLIHLSKIDGIVRSSHPLPELQPPGMGPREERIGQYVAELIPDGATVEIGIGGIPSAVARFLRGKKDLGIHSGMISDSVKELMESGVVTNSKKPIDRGKSVAAMAMGSNGFYRWLHENRTVLMRSASYTHCPAVLSRITGLVALNSALQVDLSGQANGEAVSGLVVSGMGGGVDFARGACSAAKGISIIALPSATEDDKGSRIVPFLGQGSPVTFQRSDVHFVVTEYGVADLRCKSLLERAKALIQVAHPAFREDLINHVRKAAL